MTLPQIGMGLSIMAATSGQAIFISTEKLRPYGE